MAVSRENLSPYTQQLGEILDIKGQPQKKLMPNLQDKTKYVVHYVNLKQYLRLGLKLKKIHRVIEFHQSYWLREYITLNTNKRKLARNSFEKDFFKLMNNSIFGKMMENVRGRMNMELVHTPRRLKKLVAKPNYNRFHIFNKDLMAVHCLKNTVELNKPIYVGLAILDVSKTLMYEFHYGYIKTKYDTNAQLCFTDTDSLLYDIKTEDVYSDMKDDLDMFDTCDYPADHMLHSVVNKKVIGKMKDEMAGAPIQEFVGLRSKMYSVLCGGVEKKIAKGVKRAAIRTKLRHVMYRDVLLNESTTHATMQSIRSRNHKIYSIRSNKLALSPYDDKRFVLDDKITTRAHGHYSNM